MYKCKICGKEFENGRALGGHISIVHKQDRKELNNSIRKKRIKAEKICPKCGNKFEIERIIEKNNEIKISKYEKKFCSRSCANSKEFTEEQNKKKGRKGKNNSNYSGGRKKWKCKKCGKPIGLNKSGCCKKCYKPVITDEMRSKISKAQLKLVKEGKHHGWTVRNKKSFPEEFFTRVLKNNCFIENKDYYVNYPVRQDKLGLNNKKSYFLDFYFPKYNLDLEIDGRQHEDEDRKKSDEIRDKALINNGYKVYRIKWRELRGPSEKKYIKNEIGNFFDYIKSI